MKRMVVTSVVVLALTWKTAAQRSSSPQESAFSTRYSVTVLDDVTYYSDVSAPVPVVKNQLLLEPTFDIKYRNRWKVSTSAAGVETTYRDNVARLRVKEAYAGVSAGDWDFMAGRKMLRWGVGYAFTSAGVLDPPRIATDPGDRLNLNEGRDMVKADWVKGQHAVSLAWSTAELARKGMMVRDTTALRYNVLVRGFDTTAIAGNDRGGDSFGALTFTRVVGQAWEVHGEATWREREALLLGAKYTTPTGVTFIGEFYTPPNIPYYRSISLSPLSGRQHYAFLNAGKTRLREMPGWKEWDVAGAVVMNLDDRSRVGIVDVSRWFGEHVSSYVHVEIPGGKRESEYGGAPYGSSTSAGIRFHL
jgi:hypothetical protein